MRRMIEKEEYDVEIIHLLLFSRILWASLMLLNDYLSLHDDSEKNYAL